jgi:hypothetical protein
MSFHWHLNHGLLVRLLIRWCTSLRLHLKHFPIGHCFLIARFIFSKLPPRHGRALPGRLCTVRLHSSASQTPKISTRGSSKDSSARNICCPRGSDIAWSSISSNAKNTAWQCHQLPSLMWKSRKPSVFVDKICSIPMDYHEFPLWQITICEYAVCYRVPSYAEFLDTPICLWRRHQAAGLSSWVWERKRRRFFALKAVEMRTDAMRVCTSARSSSEKFLEFLSGRIEGRIPNLQTTFSGDLDGSCILVLTYSDWS